MLEEARAVGSKLFADLSELVRAQWRLTSYVLAGSARIWVLRFCALLLVGLLALTSWVFLNMTAWRAVVVFTALSFAPPLALLVLNSLTAAILYSWQKNLRLK